MGIRTFESAMSQNSRPALFLLTALDDLIAAKPKRGAGRGGRRGRGGRPSAGSAKAAALGSKAGSAVAAAAVNANRNKPLVIPGRAPGGNQGSKIIVSNLPTDVTEAQVKVSFHMGWPTWDAAR